MIIAFPGSIFPVSEQALEGNRVKVLSICYDLLSFSPSNLSNPSNISIPLKELSNEEYPEKDFNEEEFNEEEYRHFTAIA